MTLLQKVKKKTESRRCQIRSSLYNVFVEMFNNDRKRPFFITKIYLIKSLNVMRSQNVVMYNKCVACSQSRPSGHLLPSWYLCNSWLS